MGFSSGAIVGVRLADILRTRGVEVPLLVLVDSGPCVTAAGRRRRAITGTIRRAVRPLGIGRAGYERPSEVGGHASRAQQLMMRLHLDSLHRHRMQRYEGRCIVIPVRGDRYRHGLHAWRRVLLGPAEEFVMDASHMGMWRGESAQVLATELLRVLSASGGIDR